ncbi:MAG TPA: aminotransferase class V-fold PLP-dependent enzyme [Planctomycetota bacterium]|nr:aminotransferase class V-fold PLP-dependent enzyme [Planctomycetota bacterium]
MSSSRRRFLKSLAALPGAASLPACAEAQTPPRDVYQELGIRPLINAAGTYTYLSASRMPREVVEAVESASRHYVHLNELHSAVGKRIATLVGAEAALVTAGAASALLLGTAACLAGKDKEKIQRLPDTTGMKNEVVIPKAHRNGYDHAVRATGARLVEVGTLADAERAVTERTAMLLYFNVHGPEGPIKVEEFAALAKKREVPSLIDAAADIPPVSNYSRFLKMGYDLATFSGGKVLRGPQCSGFLLGRKDLVEAAAANNSPQTDAIGRTNKVGKEEIVGVWAALEHFLKQDPDARWREWERRCAAITRSLAGLAAVKAETFVPELANAVPHLKVTWTGAPTPADAVRQLREGEPRIEIRASLADGLEIGVWMLEAGEDEIVGRRLAEVLRR